jgi:hypothetical protein
MGITIVIIAVIGLAGWGAVRYNRHQWALRDAKYGPVKGYNCD